MSELTPILYKGLGLPYTGAGKKLAADHNELTKKADRDGNGKVSLSELVKWLATQEEAQ